MRKTLFLLFGIFVTVNCLKCYSGFQAFGSTGSETKECESGEYCYNATASAGSVLNVAKAGCSHWRCYLASNKCVNTELQGVPVSFCCCNSGDLCNGRD